MTIVVFALTIAALLIHDLYSHRNASRISGGEALPWVCLYIIAAGVFAFFLWQTRGPEFATLFVTAYVLEQALSVDNLMVFIAVFAYFGIPDRYQHKILYWGILGAIVFRLVFVLIGANALAYIGRPVQLLFGALIAWAAYKILIMDSGDPPEIDHSNRWYVRWVSKLWPVEPTTTGGRFFVRAAPRRKPGSRVGELSGIWHVTPFFLCLVSIEVMDLMFAVDSVPVVIAVARDPVIIYSAMIFAILGLRSMYFVLSALQRSLSQLGLAVGVILMFVAAKLMVEAIFGMHVDPFLSLGVVVTALLGGVLASYLFPKTA